MALPEIIRPGARVAQEYLNALRETVRRAAIQVAGPGLSSQETPGGMAVMQNPEAEQRENCLRALYGDASGAPLGLPTLPANALVHLVGGGACRLPDFTGRVRLGILQEGAAEGNCPWVQYQGIAQVYWDATSRPGWFTPPPGGASPNAGAMDAAGHRLGARQNSPFPVWDENGPLMVLDDGESDYGLEYGDPLWALTANPGAAGPKLRLATVAILGGRESAALYCSQPGFGGSDVWLRGAYDCLVFGAGYTVTESDGDIEADL